MAGGRLGRRALRRRALVSTSGPVHIDAWHGTLCTGTAPNVGGRVTRDIGPVLRSAHFPSSGLRGIMHVFAETFWRGGDLGVFGVR